MKALKSKIKFKVMLISVLEVQVKVKKKSKFILQIIFFNHTINLKNNIFYILQILNTKISM
jgi:hypothetical protein